MKDGDEPIEGEHADIDAFEFEFNDDQTELETAERLPDGLKFTKREARVAYLNMLKGEHLSSVLNELPAPGESIHMVSNGKYDYWTYVPHFAKLMGHVDEFYGSTWTMNRPNAVELLDMIDQGKIRKAVMLTGDYFKRRETAVYGTLLLGMQKRGMRFKAFYNHAKILLLANHDTGTYIVMEGSANFTSNPRTEQNVINNHRGLFDFHKQWMDEILEK